MNETEKKHTCGHCGASVDALVGGECIHTCSDLSEYGDRLAGAVATMRGEADELAARRPHPDGHLYDVEAGLRFRAAELDQFLQGEYYR